MLKRGFVVYGLALILCVMGLGVLGVVSATGDASLLLPAAPIFFAGPAVRSMSSIAKKWAEVTPQRAAQYEEGVKSPLRDWAKNTEAATGAYKEGITKAITAGRFEKGVVKAGNKKWQDRSALVGPARFSQGVQVAAPEFEKGFAAYRDVIEKTVLPPRFAKGDPRNIDRVRVMAAALADAKRK